MEARKHQNNEKLRRKPLNGPTVSALDHRFLVKGFAFAEFPEPQAVVNSSRLTLPEFESPGDDSESGNKTFSSKAFLLSQDMMFGRIPLT